MIFVNSPDGTTEIHFQSEDEEKRMLDILRPHGEWEKYGYETEAYDIQGNVSWGQKRKCTNCDFITTFIEDFGFYSFCPNCGADMRPRTLDEADDGAGKDGNVKEGETDIQKAWRIGFEKR